MFGLLVLLNIIGSAVCDEDTITLPQGKIEGTNNFIDGYRSYLGIPYATVMERYQEAGNPPTWNDTFAANCEITCKQFSPIFKLIIGTENCLTANVFTPSKRDPKLFPVIVFVHGGGFYWGSNTNILYNPKYLIDKEVIVVTINYRLGAFGFLCLRTKGAPGNVGIKDLVAALKWVKNNIAYFGGNPDSVTLFGESAGATSTMFLILSQAAKGLFHKAIIHSSSVNSPQIFDRRPIESAVKVAGRLGYDTTNTNDLLEIFLKSKADAIVSASHVDSTNNALAPNSLMPCIEDTTVSDNAIITRNPTEMLDLVHEISNISIIMGFNDKEGIMWASKYGTEGLKDLDKNFTSAIPRSFTFDSEECKTSFMQAIRKSYFNNSSTDYKGLIDYFTDSLITYPSVLAMEAFLKNSKVTMFNYFFKYDSFRNLNKLLSRLPLTSGAGHADELFYLFDPLVYQILPKIPSDLDFVNTMTTLWTNFAKTGEPSTKSISWVPSDDKLRFLKLDKTIKMKDLPNQDRINFWRTTEAKFGLHYP